MSQQDATPETPWILPSACNRSACPEVRRVGDTVQVRSNANEEVIVTFTEQEFADFLTAARSGEYDHLISG